MEVLPGLFDSHRCRCRDGVSVLPRGGPDVQPVVCWLTFSQLNGMSLEATAEKFGDHVEHLGAAHYVETVDEIVLSAADEKVKDIAQ